MGRVGSELSEPNVWTPRTTEKQKHSFKMSRYPIALYTGWFITKQIVGSIKRCLIECRKTNKAKQSLWAIAKGAANTMNHVI